MRDDVISPALVSTYRSSLLNRSVGEVFGEVAVQTSIKAACSSCTCRGPCARLPPGLLAAGVGRETALKPRL